MRVTSRETSLAAVESILVTGGAGFIGSHLVDRLLADGRRVTVVDDLSTGDPANLESARLRFADRLEVVVGRVSDVVGDLSERRFDAIYHLAAAVGVRLVVDRPVHTIETNIHETSAILSLATRHATPILVASTSEVYGKGVKTPMAEDDDVLYGPTTVPRWSYAASKAIDEYLALAHHHADRLPVVVVRLFNTVGPRQTGEYGMVLPRFVKAAMINAPLQVYGDGLQSRCFCDVRDVVPALTSLMATDSARGMVFNLGNDHPIEIGALASMVVRILGSESGIEHRSHEAVFGRRFEDLHVRQPDLGRVREAIGFEPRIPLERTILDLAESLASESRR